MKIKNLRKLYEEILDLKEYINDVYSFFITTWITYIFLEMIYFLFLNIVQYQFREGSLVQGTTAEFLLLVYPTVILIKLIILAWCGELLRRQGKKTAIIVHKLISEITDYPTLYEVKLFTFFK